MQRFRFRLQRVLEWQQRLCDVESDKLSKCIAELARVEESLQDLEARRAAVEQAFLAEQALGPADLTALAEFRRVTVTGQLALESERQRRHEAVVAQRECFFAENRKLRILEKLRERALREHSLALDREVEALSLESYLATWAARN